MDGFLETSEPLGTLRAVRGIFMGNKAASFASTLTQHIMTARLSGVVRCMFEETLTAGMMAPYIPHPIQYALAVPSAVADLVHHVCEVYGVSPLGFKRQIGFLGHESALAKLRLPHSMRI